MRVHVDYMKVTDSTVLAPITIQFDRRDLNFQTKEGLATATVNVYARITSPSRRVVNVFEEAMTIDVPTALLQEAAKGSSIYQKTVPLTPGLYRLNIVAKDLISGNMSSYEAALNVPRFEQEKLASSSLILADMIERVPTNSIGSGQFVIGDTKVRPRLGENFERSEKLGIYVQLYNFSGDPKTHRPDAAIQYEIVKAGTSTKVLEYSEDANTLPGASEQQVTIQRMLPLQSLEPGQYTLTIRVTDRAAKQTISPTAGFTVK